MALCHDMDHTKIKMRPINPNTAESANIINMEVLKKASEPQEKIVSIVEDVFAGIDKMSQNPVLQPLIGATTDYIKAKAQTLVVEATKKSKTVDADVTVLYE